MFGRKRREQEQFEAVAEYMDQRESESWAWRQVADREGDEAADRLHPRTKDVADIVSDLLPRCGDDAYGPRASRWAHVRIMSESLSPT
jgi:hypothetical protein